MAKLEAEEYKTFESIKKTNNEGEEFWSARDLSKILDYIEWRNFEKVINRARLSCENSGFSEVEHFVEVNKMLEMPNNAKKKVKDFELSRYACYLIVQNGDSRKEIIALGQTYFAIQTRRQEVADYFNQLDEDNKRLVIRGDIKQWNQMLVETAHNAGVITNEEYAKFQNAGYMGLYGGLTVEGIHKRKNLKDKAKILDFMGSEELGANIFRITQTEAKLRKDKVNNADDATETHYNVAKKVRHTIKELGATMPEDLPTPEKSITEIEKEQLRKLKKSKKKLMLDE